jgi:hypothetical protein
VARRGAARGRARGGEGIPSLHASRPRLTTAGLAFAALGAVATHTALSGGRFVEVGDGLAAAGGGALLVAFCFRLPGVGMWAVGLVGVGYVVGRSHHSTVDGGAALIGGALLLAAELIAWSIDDDRRFDLDRSLVIRRGLLVAALVAASTLVSLVLVATAGLSGSSGALLSAVGVAAAIGALATLLRLVRSSPAGSETGGAGVDD